MSIVLMILLTVVGGATMIVFFLCPFIGMIVMSGERTDASKKAVLEGECHTYYPVVLKRTKKLLVVYLVSALCVVVPVILYMISKAWLPAIIALIIYIILICCKNILVLSKSRGYYSDIT